MNMFLFVVLNIILTSTLSLATQINVEYQNSSYTLEKRSEFISFKDRWGSVYLKLNSCNRQIINSYWNRLEYIIVDPSNSKTSYMLDAKLVVMIDGVKSLLPSSSFAGGMLKLVPKSIYYLKLEDALLCQKK